MRYLAGGKKISMVRDSCEGWHGRRIPAMVETYWRSVDLPFLRVKVTGCWMGALSGGGFCDGVGFGRRALTLLSPPAHVNLVGWPATTEEGRVVNAIWDCAMAAPRREAPKRRKFANCIVAMFTLLLKIVDNGDGLRKWARILTRYYYFDKE